MKMMKRPKGWVNADAVRVVRNGGKLVVQIRRKKKAKANPRAGGWMTSAEVKKRNDKIERKLRAMQRAADKRRRAAEKKEARRQKALKKLEAQAKRDRKAFYRGNPTKRATKRKATRRRKTNPKERLKKFQVVGFNHSTGRTVKKIYQAESASGAKQKASRDKRWPQNAYIVDALEK